MKNEKSALLFGKKCHNREKKESLQQIMDKMVFGLRKKNHHALNVLNVKQL